MKKLVIMLLLVFATMISSASVTQAATISIGASGTEIGSLQSDLISLNYSVGSVDGIYGRKTKEAVQVFQQNMNLVADGIVGTQTRNALTMALNPSTLKSRSDIISTAKEFKTHS